MPLLISLSFVLFILDIFSSLKTVKQWLLFENTCSLLTGLMQFFHDGQYILLIIVALFSLIVPLIKLFLVTFAINTSSWAASERHSIIHWLSLVGKCSMIDVFIVAILVVAIAALLILL